MRNDCGCCRETNTMCAAHEELAENAYTTRQMDRNGD